MRATVLACWAVVATLVMVVVVVESKPYSPPAFDIAAAYEAYHQLWVSEARRNAVAPLSFSQHLAQSQPRLGIRKMATVRKASVVEKPPQEKLTTETGNPVAEEKTQEPVAKEKTQEPLAEEKTQEPVAAEKTQEPVAAEKTQEPVAEEKTQIPVAPENTQEPVAEEKTQNPVAEEKSVVVEQQNESQTVPEEQTPEVITEQLTHATKTVELTITEQPVQEEATTEMPKKEQTTAETRVASKQAAPKQVLLRPTSSSATDMKAAFDNFFARWNAERIRNSRPPVATPIPPLSTFLRQETPAMKQPVTSKPVDPPAETPTPEAPVDTLTKKADPSPPVANPPAAPPVADWLSLAQQQGAAPLIIVLQHPGAAAPVLS